MKQRIGMVLLGLALLLAACGQSAPPAGGENQPAAAGTEAGTEADTDTDTGTDSPVNVTFGLDWTPNTNHTGLYVAQEEGYYQEEGLAVDIVQAQEGGTVEQLVAAGRLDFGVSFQENVTNARLEEVPIVSIAAIIQHNTSGFASRADAGITRPADFAGKKYGSWGSPMERAVIEELMACDGGDFAAVEFVDVGSSDFFVATERGDVDFMWIFQGWTGIEAEIRGIDINTVMINDLDCVPDYYTPVIITSEQMIAERPEVVRGFLNATSRGYQFAIENSDEAATMLLAAAPELDEELVIQSQRYLAEEYQADAPRWGEQERETWERFAQWMLDSGQIERMIDADAVFTNDFLP